VLRFYLTSTELEVQNLNTYCFNRHSIFT